MVELAGFVGTKWTLGRLVSFERCKLGRQVTGLEHNLDTTLGRFREFPLLARDFSICQLTPSSTVNASN